MNEHPIHNGFLKELHSERIREFHVVHRRNFGEVRKVEALKVFGHTGELLEVLKVHRDSEIRAKLLLFLLSGLLTENIDIGSQLTFSFYVFKVKNGFGLKILKNRFKTLS